MQEKLEKWDLTSVIIVASTIFICFTLKRNVNVLKTVWNKNKKQRTYHHHRHSISENEIFLWMKRDGGHHEMQQPVSPKIATLYADRPSRVSSRFFVQAGHETKYASSRNHHFFQVVYQVIVRPTKIMNRANKNCVHI